MKILITVQENFALMGISTNQSIQKIPFNAKNVLMLVIQCLTFSSDLMCLIYEADNFKDYTISIFSCCTMIVAISIFAMIMIKMRHFFEFQEQIEEIINKSKRKYIK